MSSGRAKVLLLATLALVATLALALLPQRLRLSASGEAFDERGSLRPGGLAVLSGAVVLCLAAAVVAALVLRAGTASERQEWLLGLTGGDPARAPRLMVENGCAGCHVIPGVPGANGRTGPALVDLGQQKFIAGTLPNTPDSLVAFVRDARRFVPHGAMPSTGISEADARAIAAYLYQLRR
ncbi:MAG: c-type cytochrome [Pararhizobium sp.]